MEIITHFVLLTGLCFSFLQASADEVARYRFVLFFTPKTWKEAQIRCREECIDLATFNYMEETGDILSFIEGKYDDAIWFGMWKGETRSWHWSLTRKDFYKEGEKDYMPWFFQPTYHCGTYKQGYMYSLPCSSTLPSVCVAVSKNGKAQYVLINEVMSWTSAQTFCRTFYTDLTSVRNPIEAGIIQEIIGYTEVWIGLFRDPWVWSDHGDSSLRLWSADQMVWSDDSSECAAMLKNESGRWGGRNCTERHPFFCSCKYPESKQTYVKVRLNLSPSALNLNHPNVQKTLLKQMELKLIEDGLDVTQTTWLKQPDGKIFVKETP